MNTKEVLDQVKTSLRNQTWTGGVKKVFSTNSVVVTGAPEENALVKLRPPIALIRPGGASSDPEFQEEPDLIHQDVVVQLIVRNHGDSLGEASLMGGFRSQGADNSLGKGLLEVEAELFNAIKFLNQKDNIKVQWRATGAAVSEENPRMGTITWRDYLFTAVTTANPD